MGAASTQGRHDPDQVHGSANRHAVLTGHASTPLHTGHTSGLKASISIQPPHGPLRGERVKLSAGHSTGNIKKYEWSFSFNDSPTNDTPPSNEETILELTNPSSEGKDISFVVLRPLKVTLKVTDADNSSALTQAVINVKVRTWSTPITLREDLIPVNATFAPGWYYFGMSNCTTEGFQAAGHMLHCVDHGGKDYNFEDDDVGFRLDRVIDPDGPFHDFFYVTSYKLYIDRTRLINKKLLPGGEVYKLNQDHPTRLKTLNLLVESVKEHEKIHGTLVKAALPKLDPAPMVETYIHTSQEQLSSLTNKACTKANASLMEATDEEKVHEQLRAKGNRRFDVDGTLFVLYDGRTIDYYMPRISDLGDISPN